MKIIYLIRHSGPFVNIDNYNDYFNISWNIYNKNMILNTEGENKAKELSNNNEFVNTDEIYSADSARAIATAKYIAEKNNLSIKLDERINERNLGIKTISQLPNDFNKKSFDKKDYKIFGGESLNEVDERMNSFINDIIHNNCNKTIIVTHGIILLSFLSSLCNFSYDGKTFFIKYNNNVLVNGNPRNPDVFKLTIDHDKIINIENIKI